MEGYKVGIRQQVLHTEGLAYLRGHFPGTLDGDTRVKPDNVHSQGQCAIGHLDADGAESDNTQRLAGQLEPDKLFLAGLDLPVNLAVFAFQ